MSEKKPQIYFDISVLGFGHFSNTSRTGVFRTIEELLKKLLLSDQIDIYLVALQSNATLCKTYIKANRSWLKKKLFYHFTINSYLNDIILIINSKISQIKNPLQRLFFRLIRKTCTIFLNNKDVSSLPNIDLKGLVHSPYYAIPKKYHLNKKILMIHDMIPVLFPEYFQENHRSDFDKIITSIDKNTTIICNSNATKLDFCRTINHFNPNKVFVTHLAAFNQKKTYMPQSEEVIEKYHLPKNFILSVSTLEPRKNLTSLVQAFESLDKDELKDHYLVLTGTAGWKFENLLQASKNKDRIIFTGFVSNEELAAIYSLATGFVYPSLYEGFGLPPLEAMSYGSPVISSNRASLLEVVGDAAMLIDPENPSEIAKAIDRIINDTKLQKTMSEKSKKQASLFSWQKCAKETVDVYYIANNN